MSLHRQLFADAREAYGDGKYAEAALVLQRSASAALEVGDRVAWFQSMVWAAESIRSAGKIPSAMAFLLAARELEPNDADPIDSWMARKELLYITFDSRPERKRIEELLTDLRVYAANRSTPRSDLLALEADVYEATGEWERALNLLENAWQVHDGKGRLKSGFAASAAECCIRLGRLRSARDWLDALRSLGKENFEHLMQILAIEVDIAFAEDKRDRLTALCRALVDRTFGVQASDMLDDVREKVVRVHLLECDGRDPCDFLHEARAELLRRPSARHDVHRRYANILLFLDYRLACLRYAAAVPPVDDFYYFRPQMIRSVGKGSDVEECARRLAKARQAFKWAMSYARRLDSWLECDRHEREVFSRGVRISEIAVALAL